MSHLKLDLALAKRFDVQIVALPLGHPDDLTLRALEALRMSEVIYCEDTRKIVRLLTHHKIETGEKRMISLPGDQERERSWARDFENFVSEKKFHVVLVSDAGTPVLNDPGYALIQFCREHRINLRALPGATAPFLALQWSGGFGLPFYFAGFAPKAKSEESQDLEKFFAPLKAETIGTFCFFDSKYQLETTLAYLARDAELSTREVFLAREMTKAHEELLHGTAERLGAWLQERMQTEGALGEITLLIQGRSGSPSKTQSSGQIEQQKNISVSTSSVSEVLNFCTIIRKGTPKEAAKALSKIVGLDVSECYRILSQK